MQYYFIADSGYKESQFYSLPFGQAVTSMNNNKNNNNNNNGIYIALIHRCSKCFTM